MQPNKLLIEHFDVFIFQYFFYTRFYKTGSTYSFVIVLNEKYDE